MRKSPRGEGDQSVQNCSTSTGTSKDWIHECILRHKAGCYRKHKNDQNTITVYFMLAIRHSTTSGSSGGQIGHEIQVSLLIFKLWGMIYWCENNFCLISHQFYSIVWHFY
jgi:hypothetical protein